MRVTITGATGLIGPRLIRVLQERGDEITVLSRNADKARSALPGVEAIAWAKPESEPAPAEAFAGRDAVVHLAGEPVAQRWNADVKRKIEESRTKGTRNLLAGMRTAENGPEVLVSSSAVGYYGPHGTEELPEETPPGDDFLAKVCVEWEQEARKAEADGARVVLVRTGIVLDEDGGALEKMLPPFKLGVGGPVAGGSQYMPWIHLDDLVGIYVQALDDASWSGPVNGSAPKPITNKQFSKALGKVLKRPAFSPVPAFAIKLLYGEMSEIVTKGQNAVPKRTFQLGYRFKHTEIEPALRDALGR